MLGIGFAATRDLNAFFRYAAHDDAESQPFSNPLGQKVAFGVARGSSQSGNFLRSFINLGFNQDESGRIVWDGINPNIAVRQLAMNFRFASPGGGAELYKPGSAGVVWWSDYNDEARGRPEGGLLDRCRATDTCPKVFETFGSFEFWGLRGSPDLVGTRADRDIPLPPNVRRYYFPGVTHGGGRGGFSPSAPAPPGACELPANPNPSSDSMRAWTVALVDWVIKERRRRQASIRVWTAASSLRPRGRPSALLRFPECRFPMASSTRFTTTILAPRSSTPTCAA